MSTRLQYCRWLTTTEDKVEDAITGNHLQIKDQLIFMAIHNVPDGCMPPEYQGVSDVPELVHQVLEPSPYTCAMRICMDMCIYLCPSSSTRCSSRRRAARTAGTPHSLSSAVRGRAPARRG